jgi:hypothetical protein
MFDFLKSPKSRLSGKRRREDDILGRTNDAAQRLKNAQGRTVDRTMRAAKTLMSDPNFADSIRKSNAYADAEMRRPKQALQPKDPNQTQDDVDKWREKMKAKRAARAASEFKNGGKVRDYPK